MARQASSGDVERAGKYHAGQIENLTKAVERAKLSLAQFEPETPEYKLREVLLQTYQNRLGEHEAALAQLQIPDE